MPVFLQSLAPGTLPQWGMFVTLLAILAGIITVYIRGMPERRRAANEAKALENADAAALREEYTKLHQKNRDDYHALSNRFMGLEGAQRKCITALAEAHAENRMYRDDMQTLLFLIRLLISEVKRLDKDPKNVIIAQAEMTLTELERKREEAGKVLATLADEAVVAAEAATEAVVATRDGIAAEGKK